MTTNYILQIGIVGRTGVGKSSLMKAVLRLVDAHGEIEFDGINIKSLGLAELRSAITTVPQVRKVQHLILD